MDVISIFFAVINFAIIIGLLVYVWRTSVAPQLAASMAQQEQELQEQEQQKLHFKTLHQDILQEKKEQKEFFLDLQNKFGIWSGVVQEQYKLQHQEVCVRQEEIEKYTQQKKAYLRYHVLLRRVIPHMIQNIQHDATLYYASGNHAQEYFTKHTAFMKDLV
jgi:hypothetical protein